MVIDKVKIFYKESIAVHIVTKSGGWVNGYILDIGNEDYFMVNDFKKGEMPVFYKEVSVLDKFVYSGASE